MTIQSQHITGFAVGVGAAAVGFYLYKQNQQKVDTFLRQHGIDMPAAGTVDSDGLSLEQLVSEKERLEDIIAEREYAARQAAQEKPEPAGPKKRTARKATDGKKKPDGSTSA